MFYGSINKNCLYLYLQLCCVFQHYYSFSKFISMVIIQHMVVQKYVGCGLISYTEKAIILCLSHGDEIRSVTKERSCPIVWWYGSGYLCIFCEMTTGCADWPGIGVVSVLRVCEQHHVTRCRASLSWAMHELCQFVMFPVRMLPTAPL